MTSNQIRIINKITKFKRLNQKIIRNKIQIHNQRNKKIFGEKSTLKPKVKVSQVKKENKVKIVIINYLKMKNVHLFPIKNIIQDLKVRFLMIQLTMKLSVKLKK